VISSNFLFFFFLVVVITSSSFTTLFRFFVSGFDALFGDGLNGKQREKSSFSSFSLVLFAVLLVFAVVHKGELKNVFKSAGVFFLWFPNTISLSLSDAMPMRTRISRTI
jgi:hypothetical protein